MYEILNEFTSVKTWTSHHHEDDGRFYRAINRIVREKNFDSQKVGEFIKNKFVEQFGQPDKATKFAADYAERAYTIRSFVRAVE